MIWLVLAAHLHFWPGPDVEIDAPDAKAQQEAIDHAASMAGPPGCRGGFDGCQPWVIDT